MPCSLKYANSQKCLSHDFLTLDLSCYNELNAGLNIAVFLLFCILKQCS